MIMENSHYISAVLLLIAWAVVLIGYKLEVLSIFFLFLH